jgi:hypothetical protein
VSRLASAQHFRESRLFGGCDCQAVYSLDFDPHFSISAPVRFCVDVSVNRRSAVIRNALTERRSPSLRTVVTLGLVDIVRHGEKLRVGEIVGERLTLSRGPSSGTGLVTKSVSLFIQLTPCVRSALSMMHQIKSVWCCTLTFQALDKGTRWSMSTSLEAVQVAPS